MMFSVMVEPFEILRLAPSQAHTAALAQALSAHLRVGDVIGLTGVLGAGKTTLRPLSPAP